MGMIDRFIGVGSTVTAVGNAASGVAEILTPSATRRMELDEDAHARALAEHQAEFAAPSAHWFDAVMNGLNRLPRPLLTLGTIGLFIYAMAEPVGFSQRMQGLALVPEPLWWLMGAIVSFYFGAREAHYFRRRVWPNATVRTQVVGAAASAGDDGWRAPAPPVPQADAADGWQAPAPPPLVAEAVVTEVEHHLDAVPTPVPAPAPAAPAPRAGEFADNAALRDWALSRAAAQD